MRSYHLLISAFSHTLILSPDPFSLLLKANFYFFGSMNPRFQAIEQIQKRPRRSPLETSPRPSEIFAENVFNPKAMKQYLSNDIFETLLSCMQNGQFLDRNIASAVANAVKSWALDKGATHFTHWFQPLSGYTAEKHESFLELSDDEPIDKFSGEELAQQQPDASSFPGGGKRSTFEARGYTAWDCSSPIFVFETTYGRTLCIPTIFVSFNGKALDYKLPLLKSMSLLDKAATGVCNLFDKEIKRVFPTLGIEQEYFLIDRSFYYLRPDLLLTGRTVFGADSARGQQLDDHYFGSIPERAFAFMNELELECHRLGIPLKTRHNEVAPSQFECAPRFENLNVAIDHSLMISDLIDRTAKKHNLAALMHEKPFAGVNGSGKHNNWSLSTDTGKNLLSPGSDPQENLLFLTIFVSVIKAVSTYADLLGASIVSAGNDYRLGAHDAPPPIMSVFVGNKLRKILQDLDNPPRKRKHEPINELLRLGISEIPELLIDNTDTNRTSPFAFTGNKFEFRAVGASANCSQAMTILNTIVADQLKEFKERVEAKLRRGRNLDLAVLDILKEYVPACKSILFDGDGYSPSWQTEAEKRGLVKLKKTPYALTAYMSPHVQELFERSEVLSPEELEARFEVSLEGYLNRVRIEADIIEELGHTSIIPSILAYQKELLESLRLGQESGLDRKALSVQEDLAVVLGEKSGILFSALEKLRTTRARIERRGYNQEIAKGYAEQILPIFDEIRTSVDELEGRVADAHWPLPKYRELLFVN